MILPIFIFTLLIGSAIASIYMSFDKCNNAMDDVSECMKAGNSAENCKKLYLPNDCEDRD